jgi:rSAM/selenodomain-associated transferase 1
MNPSRPADTALPAAPVVHVFARWWAEGPVKTRLAAELGQEAAREVYRRLAEHCWRAVAGAGWQRWLWVEPGDRATEAGGWLSGADRVLAQPAGDLGARMLHAFEAAAAAAAPWSAVVGTDAPELGAKQVAAAAAALVPGAGPGGEPPADLALVPTLDGGYALLAARAPHPELFRGIPWSTSEVAAATHRAAAAAGLGVRTLSPTFDIDRAEDWKRWSRKAISGNGR